MKSMLVKNKVFAVRCGGKGRRRKEGNSDIFPTRVYARAFPSDVGLFAVTSVTRGRTMVYEFCKMQRLEMCSFGCCDSKKRVVKAMKG